MFFSNNGLTLRFNTVSKNSILTINNLKSKEIMKTLKNVMTAFACILFLSSATYAQYPSELTNWSASARLGLYFSHTDVTTGLGMAAEGSLERKFGDRIAIQGSMLFGSLSGGSGDKQSLTILPSGNFKATEFNYAFQTRVFEMILSGKYYIQRETISPFAQLGGGMIFYDTEVDLDGDGSFDHQTGWNLVSTDKNKESSVFKNGVPIGTWIVPVGIGCNYSVNEWFDISATYTFRFTGTDNIDAVSPSSGGVTNAGGVQTPGNILNYIQANPTTYTPQQFQEVSAFRQERAGTGSDMLSLFTIGLTYNFANPAGGAAGESKPKSDE